MVALLMGFVILHIPHMDPAPKNIRATDNPPESLFCLHLRILPRQNQIYGTGACSPGSETGRKLREV